MFTRICAVFLFVITLSGCNVAGLIESTAPEGDVTYAKSKIAQLQAHDRAALLADADPQLKAQATPDGLTQLEQMFAGEAPSAVSVESWTRFASTSESTTTIVLWCDFPSGRGIRATVGFRPGARRVLTSLYLLPVSVEQRSQSNFTIENKPVVNYVFLGLAILIPIFIIVTFIVCLRTRGLRRKWLWCIGILFGVCQFAFNWATGEIGINPISFGLLGAAFVQNGFYGPWILSLYLPLFAILFWLKRQRLKDQTGTPAQSPPTTPMRGTIS